MGHGGARRHGHRDPLTRGVARALLVVRAVFGGASLIRSSVQHGGKPIKWLGDAVPLLRAQLG